MLRRAGGEFAEARDHHVVHETDHRLAHAFDLILRVGGLDAVEPSRCRGTYSKPSGSMTIARRLPAVTPLTRTVAWCAASAIVGRTRDERRIEFELNVALRRGLLAHHEVAAPQRAGAQLGELRVVAARVAHAIRAGRELEVFRQREFVELHGVRAGLEAFEVEAAVLRR